MGARINTLFAIFLGLLLPLAGACAHETGAPHDHDPSLIANWHFQPDYSLPGNAAVTPPRHPNPAPERIVMQGETVPQVFLGARETGRYSDLLTSETLPQDAFTIELWLLEHVNTDVGALAGTFSGPGKRDGHWALGLHGKTLVFGALTDGGKAITLDVPEADLDAYKGRWIQLVGSWDGEMLRLYHNGRLVGAKAPGDLPQLPADARFDLVSFTGNEP